MPGHLKIQGIDFGVNSEVDSLARSDEKHSLAQGYKEKKKTNTHIDRNESLAQLEDPQFLPK